jgi:hypothetical protein
MQSYADKMFALVSTMAMKNNTPDTPDSTTPKGRGKKKRPENPCLALGCDEITPYPLCGTHYHALISGKHSTLALINGYGNASYNLETKLVTYPSSVPENRMPSNVRKVKAAMGTVDPQ